MSGNFNRRLSSSVPYDPPYIARPDPREVSHKPARFDTRYLAWKLFNPDHKQANDKSLTERGRWPRLQADDSCNLLELYDHIEYYIEDYQTVFTRYEDRPNILLMPYQFITPQPGWKLVDIEDNTEYTVKGILTSRDLNGVSTFDGRVILTAEGPVNTRTLRWLDPYGEQDEQVKLIKIRHNEDIRQVIETRKQEGDTANVMGSSFTPIIGYSLIIQEPGSRGSEPFGPSKEIKPTIRLVAQDPDSPDTIQKVFGWWMDNLIEFKVYALGGKIADRVSVWLNNFFKRYNHVLMALGTQQIIYWGIRQDKEENRSVYDLSVRSVRYYFRLEELEIELNGKLMSYNVNMTMSDFGSMDPWYTSEPTPTMFQTDTSGTSPLYGSPNIGDNN